MSILPTCFQVAKAIRKHCENGCIALEGQGITMPKKGDTTYFWNRYRKFKSPFVIYGDFECLTTQCQSPNSNVDLTKSFTEKNQHHTPSGYKICIVNPTTNEVESYVYRGTDAIEHFTKQIKEIRDKIVKAYKTNEPMNLTGAEER